MVNTVIRTRDAVPEIPALKKVAAYARVSSGKDEMLHSLAAQVSYFNHYIRQHPGWIFAGIYFDEAITGTKNNRPEFMRMIEDCRKGKIDLILTKSISRFARNTVDLLTIIRELKSLGVDVFFEEQNIHTLSEDGEFILTVLASYFQEEALSVSENCKWQIRKRFAMGELVNLRFMFGYTIAKDKVRIDPQQANFVRMIFHDYINGMGGCKIARKLRELGIPTERNGTWDGERVIKIIKNEKYTGNALLQKKYVADHLTKKLVPNKGILPKYEAKETHPAIIDQETFGKAQAVLQERLKSCGNKSKVQNTYPFSSMIRCGHCGKNYKRLKAQGKPAWNCSTYLKKSKDVCPGKQLPEEMLQKMAAEVLGQDLFDADNFRSQISELITQDTNRLVFVFRDGHTQERIWQQRSRSESWTGEMRQAAREYANRR